MSEMKDILGQAKRWIKQEQVWDDQVFCSNDNKAVIASPASSGPHENAGRSNLSEARQIASSVAPSGRRPRNDGKKAAALKALYETYKDCTRCPLGHTRIKFVFGVGPADAEVMFIGEGPGYEEDRRGEPFVGKAGQLLDKMLEAIGLSRKTSAYIANIVKCHAMVDPAHSEMRGNDRAPNPLEVETCSPILRQQIAIIQPRIIVTLGSPSTKMILNTKEGITGLRGKFFPFPVDFHYPQDSIEPSENLSLFGEETIEKNPVARSPAPPLALSAEEREALAKIQVLPTYHPAALLRNPNFKPESWADLKLLRDTILSSESR